MKISALQLAVISTMANYIILTMVQANKPMTVTGAQTSWNMPMP